MTEQELIEKLITSSLAKGVNYRIWEKEVSNMKNFDESITLQNAREYMSKHEYDHIEALVEFGYIKKNKALLTFELGLNESTKFLRDIAYTYTVEQGFITESENDYYEIALEQSKITMKHFYSKKQKTDGGN